MPFHPLTFILSDSEVRLFGCTDAIWSFGLVRHHSEATTASCSFGSRIRGLIRKLSNWKLLFELSNLVVITVCPKRELPQSDVHFLLEEEVFS